MKFLRHDICLVIFSLILAATVLAGCSSKQDATSKQLQAIDTIRTILELPKSKLVFVEMTGMTNSPSGDLQVALYQDVEGRQYFVNPATNLVVEIDARSMLSAIPAGAALLSETEITNKVQKYISATIPNCKASQARWSYEACNKGDNYFFSWYADLQPGSMNRPFAQIGYNRSGILFAYYNTLFVTSQ